METNTAALNNKKKRFMVTSLGAKSVCSRHEGGSRAPALLRRGTPSERIRRRLVLDRDPLPLGELLPVGDAAMAAAVAGRAAPAEGHPGLIRHRLVVDV